MSGWYLELSKLFLEAVYCTNQFYFPLCYTMFVRLLPDMFSLKWCLYILIVIIYDIKLDSEAVYWYSNSVPFTTSLSLEQKTDIHILVWQLQTTTEVHNSIMMIKWGRPCKDFCIVLTHITHLINISIYYYFIIL